MTRDQKFRLKTCPVTAGPGNIPTEAIKVMDDGNIEVLVKLFNAIYDSGHIPSDWLQSTFIMIPK